MFVGWALPYPIRDGPSGQRATDREVWEKRTRDKKDAKEE